MKLFRKRKIQKLKNKVIIRQLIIMCVCVCTDEFVGICERIITEETTKEQDKHF